MWCKAGGTSSNKDGVGWTFLAEGTVLSDSDVHGVWEKHMVFGNQQVVLFAWIKNNLCNGFVSATQDTVWYFNAYMQR